jgi:hypothetical protein
MDRDRCARGNCTPSSARAKPRAQRGSDVAAGGNQRQQTMLRTDPTGGPKLFQRGSGSTRVAVSTTGNCSNPRALAQALPGAHAMVDTAVNWFISLHPSDVARVNLLLQANFMSSSDEVREKVKSRLLRIREVLAAAQTGKFTFNCVPGTNPACQGNNGFVMTNDRSVIHLYPSFFDLTPEGRRWTLIHESAHVAGAMESPEFYYGLFGPIDEKACRVETRSISTSVALGHADNYARLVWCLTRPPDREVTPP